MKSVFLFLTSAIGMGGEIAPAGSVVEVTEAEAINFLNRGKARLATSEDDPEVPAGNGGDIGGPDDADDTDNEPNEPAAPAPAKEKGTTK